MKKGIENREYTRIEMKVEVEVEKISNGEKQMGKTNCVSMKGLFIDCESSCPVGEECYITLFIGGQDSNRQVQVKAKVVFHKKKGMGVEILSHLGLDSYDHLHRLVLYNAADEADKVEEEIEDHLHQDSSL